MDITPQFENLQNHNLNSLRLFKPNMIAVHNTDVFYTAIAPQPWNKLIKRWNTIDDIA